VTVSAATREIVRRRADYTCEYCGIREADVGGQLTIDHFQPRSKGGVDDEENLIYCCIWCNQRKMAYWPENDTDIQLLNPRQNHTSDHLITLDDGLLRPLTDVGAFTIRRLQLNRPALVAYRLRQRYFVEQDRLLTHYRDLLSLHTQLLAQLTIMIEEQQALLAEQQMYLDLLLRYIPREE
jgi:hypothetical protein